MAKKNEYIKIKKEKWDKIIQKLNDDSLNNNYDYDIENYIKKLFLNLLYSLKEDKNNETD